MIQRTTWREMSPWSRPREPDPPPAAARAAPISAAELHAKYLDEVFRFVSRRLARREDAEDTTAEVFEAAFHSLPSYRGDVEPRLWLLGIARRKVADALRQKSRRPAPQVLPEDADPDETRHPNPDDPARALARSESASKVREVLAGMKDEHREVLLLCYVEEMSHDEIAIVLGRSPQAVNSLLQRARKAAWKRGHKYFLPDEVKP